MKEKPKPVKLEVEITEKTGKRRVTLEARAAELIEECTVGLVVMLMLKNNEVYTGKFSGMEESVVMLSSTSSVSTIGVEKGYINYYFEETLSA